MLLIMIFPIIGAFIGFFLMYEMFNGFIDITLGTILGLIGALSISLHMVFTEQYIEENDPVVFAVIQIIISLLLSLVFAFVFNPSPDFTNISIESWLSIVYLAIFTTVFTFLLQNWCQKKVNSTVLSIIISLEPIFASLFGFLILDEEIDLFFLIGGGIIILSVITTILIQYKSTKISIEDKFILKI